MSSIHVLSAYIYAYNTLFRSQCVLMILIGYKHIYAFLSIIKTHCLHYLIHYHYLHTHTHTYIYIYSHGVAKGTLSREMKLSLAYHVIKGILLSFKKR